MKCRRCWALKLHRSIIAILPLRSAALHALSHLFLVPRTSWEIRSNFNGLTLISISANFDFPEPGIPQSIIMDGVQGSTSGRGDFIFFLFCREGTSFQPSSELLSSMTITSDSIEFIGGFCSSLRDVCVIGPSIKQDRCCCCCCCWVAVKNLLVKANSPPAAPRKGRLLAYRTVNLKSYNLKLVRGHFHSHHFDWNEPTILRDFFGVESLHASSLVACWSILWISRVLPRIDMSEFFMLGRDGRTGGREGGIDWWLFIHSFKSLFRAIGLGQSVTQKQVYL